MGKDPNTRTQQIQTAKERYKNRDREDEQILIWYKVEQTHDLTVKIADTLYGNGKEGLVGKVRRNGFVLKVMGWFVGVVVIAFLGAFFANLYK